MVRSTPRRHTSRAALAGLALGVAALLFASCTAQEDEMLGYMNSARRSAGVASLQSNLSLYMKASAWSKYMAGNCPSLCHSDLRSGNPYAWKLLGENVGAGPTVSGLHNAFMGSAPHRANILNYRFQYTGVGVYQAPNGIYWVTEEFMQL